MKTISDTLLLALMLYTAALAVRGQMASIPFAILCLAAVQLRNGGTK